MPAPVEVGFEANGEQNVARAWDSIKKGIEDNVRALAKITPEAQKAEQAEKDLGKAAEKWINDIRGPQQKHNLRIQELNSLLKAGKLNQDQYNQSVARSTAEMNKQKAAQGNLFQSALGGAGQMLATLTGIGSVIALVSAAAAQLRAEYQNLVTVQKTAGDRQTDTATAQRAAIFALGDDPDMSPDDLAKAAEAAALKYGKTVGEVYKVYGNTLSARNKLSSREAISSGNLALEATPAEGAMEIGGSLLDMKNRFGGTDEQQMGLSLAGQQASRVKDAAAYAQNIVPTIVQLGAYGDTAQQATALPNALTAAMDDLMGRQAATAAEKLAQQLEAHFPESQTGLKTTTERLAHVQNDPKARKKFWKNASFESGSFKAMQEITSPGDNPTKQAYASAMSVIPEMGDADKYYQKMMGRVNAQPLQQIANVKRRYQAEEDVNYIKNIKGGLGGINREGLDKFLQSAGYSDAARKVATAGYELNSGFGTDGGSTAVVKKLNREADKLSADVYVGHQGGGTAIPASPQQLAQADEFRRMAQAIDSLTRVLVEQAEKPTPVKVELKRSATAPTKPAVSSTVATGRP